MAPKEQQHIKTVASVFAKIFEPLTPAEKAARAKTIPPYIVPPCPTPKQWRKVYCAYQRLVVAVNALHPRNANGVIIVPPWKPAPPKNPLPEVPAKTQ